VGLRAPWARTLDGQDRPDPGRFIPRQWSSVVDANRGCARGM